eukprot:c14048_g1_i3.p1 GENE.c14048_g1_i3~~c14048_g1_i3.p1  ORF type:complete len:600 (-),score=145.70 c14048_g1_i3:25-1602(-)
MVFYSGSELQIQWTNQHGCGDSDINNCQILFQYMCDGNTYGNTIRDGQTQNTIDTAKPNDYSRGRHEELQHYNDCKTRKRNGGLFTADQTLDGNTAIYTRQNTNGARYGFECTEERDYYPYWHPSPWKDIVVFTSNYSMCPYYQAESQNIKAKNYCDGLKAPDPNNAGLILTGSFYNNEAECTGNGFQWKSMAAFNIPAPECRDANKEIWSRVNHLGNGLDGEENRYNWYIPSMPVDSTCVLRLRYNISTNDYAPWNTFSDVNGATKSPIKDNPTYDLNTGAIATTATGVKLKLSMNTDQFGRTFQDRSSTFIIRKAPVGGRIINLNVQGARGNIVENYPSVEYDFVPRHLYASTGDYIHRQVTGSNTTPDGAGQGRDSTDRHNFVELDNMGVNYPDYVTNVTQIPYPTSEAGYRQTKQWALLGQNDNELDDAAPYQDFGVMRYSSPMTINYMSSRTNNFSNRSEKGTVIVQTPRGASKKGVPIAIIAGAAAGGVVVIAAIGVAVWAAKTGKFAAAGTKQPSGYA